MDSTPADYLSIDKTWVERNGFSHAAMALLWVIAAFLLFQIVAGIFAVIFVFIRIFTSGTIEDVDPTMAAEMMTQNLDLVFYANSIGQIVFLGFATWLFCKLHTPKSKRTSFLRLRSGNNLGVMIGLAFGVMLTIQPVIWFLGWLNSFIPAPEMMESMQLQQMEMLESYLRSDGGVWIALLNIAVVPAVCEEVLFRGYVLRSFEKSWGIKAGIIVSGIIFGMYHLQLTNVLPLAAIGILLAYITWASQSLYPAMVAHFVNNGASILMGKFYPDTTFAEVTPQTGPPVWAVVASVAISAYLIYVMINYRKEAQTKPKGASYD